MKKNNNNKKINILKEIIILFIAAYFSLAVSTSNINIISIITVFLISYCILKILFPKLLEIKLKNKPDKIEKSEILIYILIILVIFGLTFLANYPACISPDSINQYNQTQTNEYSNWHPVIYTLIFFKLPTLIYNSYASCAIFQLLFIGCILCYLCVFLRKYFLNRNATILSLILIILNPTTLRLSVTLWKDIPFSWCLLLISLLVIEIIITNGEWINSSKNKIFLILTSLGVMLFRHNGIVNVFLLFLALIIFCKQNKKFYLITCILLISFRLLLYGPIYDSLGISKSGGKAEMLGVVMNQIAYIYHNDLMEEEEEELLNKLESKEIWEKYYVSGNFNTLKWRVNFETWANENFDQIISLWIKKGKEYPKLYIKSYLITTSSIWKIDDSTAYYRNEDKTDNKIISKARNAFNAYSDNVSNSILKYVFSNAGMGLFIIIISLGLTIYKKGLSLKYYIPFVPVISNTLVIMCLITGGEVRFVYSQILCSIPLLIYAISLKQEKSKEGKLLKKLLVNDTDNLIIQFIRYGFVGTIAAIINIGCLYLFTDIFKIYYIISNIIAFILGLTVNYILSKKIVFTKEVAVNKTVEFTVYVVIGIIGLLFDTILLWIFTDKLRMFYILSKIMSTIIVFIWNFCARKILYKIVDKRSIK